MANEQRTDVEVTELFYQKPFYDPDSKKFLGFSTVKRIVYGDEFEIDAVSQKSVFSVEEYHTFAKTAGAVALAGKLKSRQIYAVENDNALRAAARQTYRFNPNDVTQHSLSAHTQQQQLPKTGALLKQEQIQWKSVARGNDIWFIRKLSEKVINYGISEKVCPEEKTFEVCQTSKVSGQNSQRAISETFYRHYDKHNYPHQIKTILHPIKAAYGVKIPKHQQVTESEYAQARQALARFGILQNPARVKVSSDGQVLKEVIYRYSPQNGLVQAEVHRVLSRLDKLPTTLKRFKTDECYGLQSSHFGKTTSTLKNQSVKSVNPLYFAPSKRVTYLYDRYGNRTQVADRLGILETVIYDADGIFPQKQIRPYQGNSAQKNLVTEMRYHADKKGLLAAFKTPLGFWQQIQYDSLNRRVRLYADNGAEQIYRYRIGKQSLPNLIITGLKRYASQTETPTGEFQWVYNLAAYHADGTLLAKLEDADDGGVRILSYHKYNRNKNKVFQWTPYYYRNRISPRNPISHEKLDIQKVFEMGEIPVPNDQIGYRYQYDEIGRLYRQIHPSGKKVTFRYPAWGSMKIAEYQDKFAGDVKAIRYQMGNELGVYGIVEANGNNHLQDAHVTQFTRDALGNLSSILLPGENSPRRLRYNNMGQLEYQQIPGMGERFYFYDVRGRLITKAKLARTGEQHLIEKTYDGLDRLHTVHANGKLFASYRYDDYETAWQTQSAYTQPLDKPLGLLTSVTTFDPNQLFDYTEQLGYDMQGRVVQRQITLGKSSPFEKAGLGRIFGESYQYTLEGTRRRVKNPYGLETNYTLSKNLRLKAVTIDGKSFATSRTTPRGN